MVKPSVALMIGLAAFALCLGSCANRSAKGPTGNKADAALAAAIPYNDILTQHGDIYRTGANLHESSLTPASVRSGLFGRLFDWRVDAQIYTQPLYVSNLLYRGRLINMVVIATTNNSVYAFEAPAAGSSLQPSGSPLWEVHDSVLGNPLDYDYFFMPSGLFGYNIKPLIGITATPVIDRSRKRIYVTVKARAADGSESSDPTYGLFALDLLTGVVQAHVTIDAKFTNSEGFVWTLDAKHHLQRASLLEVNDRIYAAFGSHQDTTPYHGWILAFDADNLQPKGVYCTTCGHAKARDCDASCLGGIWQAGGGPAADNEGNVYVITGNGTYGNAGRDQGTSFVKLDRDLNPVGSWTPATYACLNKTDSDLGSAGPTYVESLSILVGGGKEGVLYALQPDALHGAQVGAIAAAPGRKQPCKESPLPKDSGAGYWSIQAAPLWEESAIMDLFRIFDDTVANQGFHHIHGSPAQWHVATPSGNRTLLYLSAERDLLRAYEFSSGFTNGSKPGQQPIDTFHSRCANSGHGMPGGFLTLSSNGPDAQSGIVWASMPRVDENALTNIVPGVLRAYKAYPDQGNELVELWNSDDGTKIPAACDEANSPGRDQVGFFAKFVPPTVADGKVYMSTFSGRLAVYGLKQPSTQGFALALAVGEAYDSELEIRDAPETIDSGSRVAISVTATNNGTKAWRAADDIRLSSQTVPDASYAPIEGPDVMRVKSDVAPGQSYAFNFHIVAPANEAVHHFAWRLARMSGIGKQSAEDWFGKPTSEWRFVTLRLECASVRERAKKVLALIKSDPSKAAGRQDEIASIREDAKSNNCALEAAVIDPRNH